jgi:hypothetical protein
VQDPVDLASGLTMTAHRGASHEESMEYSEKVVNALIGVLFDEIHHSLK